MESIKVTRYVSPWGAMADIEAACTQEGGVKVWFQYDEAGRRQEILISPKEWDRLAAWIELQRKEMELARGES